MSRICELYITNRSEDMFEKAYLIEGDNKQNLRHYCKIGFLQESVVVGVPLACGEIIEDIVSYLPHGKKNKEGNKIIIRSKNFNSVIIHNNTNDKLYLNKKHVIEIGGSIKL